MRFYLPLIIPMLAFSPLTAFEELSSSEIKQFQECFKINNIVPTASAKDYRTLMGSLKQQNLSVCQCVTFLSKYAHHEVIQYARGRDLLSRATLTEIQQAFADYKQRKTNAGSDLIIHFPPSFPAETRNSVVNMFATEFNITVVENNPRPCSELGTGACVFMSFGREDNASQKQYSFTVPTEDNLGIAASFQKYDAAKQKAILIHEKQHILDNHNFFGAIVGNILVFNAIGAKKALSSPQKIQHVLGQKLSRAQEAAADRIPAACSDCETALNISTYLQEVKSKLTEIPVHAREIHTHPSFKERAEWAERIYKLKVAEAELGKTDILSRLKRLYS